MIAGGQHDGVFATVILLNADVVEQLQGEADQCGLVVLFGQLGHQLLSTTATAGVDLQQTIPSLFQLALQGIVFAAGALEQRGQSLGIGDVVGQQGKQLVTHRLEDHAPGRAGLLEGVEAEVIPVLQRLLGRLLQIGDMDLDDVALADTIQTTDALLQQIRIEWQVE